MVLKHTLFATILLALLSIPASIHAEDLKGRVLDANTKEPIEKASVKIEIKSGWKSHTNLTHPGKYFRPSKVKIMRPTSPK